MAAQRADRVATAVEIEDHRVAGRAFDVDEAHRYASKLAIVHACLGRQRDHVPEHVLSLSLRRECRFSLDDTQPSVERGHFRGRYELTFVPHETFSLLTSETNTRTISPRPLVRQSRFGRQQRQAPPTSEGEQHGISQAARRPRSVFAGALALLLVAAAACGDDDDAGEEPAATDATTAATETARRHRSSGNERGAGATPPATTG